MGWHKSTSVAGTAKEKKAERRCKKRPRGAEPLKAQISSLIYKGACVNKQPHQQDNPGDAPPVPQVTGFCSPQCVGNEICSLPRPKQLGLCLLFVTWTRTMDGKHSFQEGSCTGTALVQLFLTAKRACRGGLDFFPPSLFCSFLMLCFPRSAL